MIVKLAAALLSLVMLLAGCATQDLAAEEENMRDQIEQQAVAQGTMAKDIVVERIDKDNMTATATLYGDFPNDGQQKIACNAKRDANGDYDLECKTA